jgi:phospholipase/lecithinase/hemolysin
MLKGYRLLWVIVLVVGLTPTPATADFAQIIVFGDSLSDTGNVFAAIGFPPPPYFQGRFSNGPIWVEHLAGRFNLPAPTPSLRGGTDYAFGGAESGLGFSPAGAPNLGTQLNSYLAGNTPGADQLFVLWAGADDIFNGQTNPGAIVANLVGHLTRLTQAGARQFLVGNYPLLGETPFGRTLDPLARQGLNTLTLAFNSLLESELRRLEQSLPVAITRLDTFTVFEQIRANPAAFGFTNVTAGALPSGVPSGIGYLFWDTVHPTTAGHRLIGDEAFRALSVPVPASLVLLASGGASVLGWVGCRRLRVRFGK